jgi:protein gp37
LAQSSGISWTHATQNFWVGCVKIAAGCKHCYIDRDLRKQTDPYTGQKRRPWGQLYRSDTWSNPLEWQKKLQGTGKAIRVFTNSDADFFFSNEEATKSPFDFFHNDPDQWRAQAWKIIRETPNLVWLILTKRAGNIRAMLPPDWNGGYKNVWLGVSICERKDVRNMDILRKIPVHKEAVRWCSFEPLLADIAAGVNLKGFGWAVVGGESGGGMEPGEEYMHGALPAENAARRTMLYKWAANLRDKITAANPPVRFYFKQVSAPKSGAGANALDGKLWHDFADPPKGLQWKPYEHKSKLLTPGEWQRYKHCGGVYPYADPVKARTMKRSHGNPALLLVDLARGGNQLAAKELNARDRKLLHLRHKAKAAKKKQ